MTTHLPDRPFKCSTCNKSFKAKTVLAKHEKIHSERTTFQCDLCEKKFLSQQSMTTHILRHTNQYVAKCEQCNQGFFSRAQYNLHVESEHYNQSICDMCGKKFSNKYNLKYHLMETHGQGQETETRKCRVCQKEVRFLRIHMRRYHTVKKPRKPTLCDLCGKEFRTKEGLKMHLMKHQGIKPYQCEYCEKSFTIKDNLKLHIRTHTGEKPHQCPVCQKCFSQITPLKVHMRTHSGEKPFECFLCNSKFASRTMLNIHKKNKHKIV